MNGYLQHTKWPEWTGLVCFKLNSSSQVESASTLYVGCLISKIIIPENLSLSISLFFWYRSLKVFVLCFIRFHALITLRSGTNQKKISRIVLLRAYFFVFVSQHEAPASWSLSQSSNVNCSQFPMWKISAVKKVKLKQGHTFCVTLLTAQLTECARLNVGWPQTSDRHTYWPFKIPRRLPKCASSCRRMSCKTSRCGMKQPVNVNFDMTNSRLQ